MDDELIAALVDSAPDALVVTDQHGTIELVNTRAEELFGYCRDDLLGQPVELLVPDDDRGTHRDHRTRYRSAPAPRPMGQGMTLRARRADGSEIPVEISLSPVSSPGGGNHIVAAVRDVTERYRAERYSQAILRGVDMAVEAIFIVDEETLEIAYVNQRGADLYGYAVEDMIGMTALDLNPEADRQALRERLAPLTTGTATSITYESRNRRADGSELWVEIHANQPPATDGASRPFVAIVRDISRRIAAEATSRQLQQLNDALSQIRLTMLQGASRADGLELVCQLVAANVDASTAFILTPSGSDDELRIEASAHLQPAVAERLSFYRSVGEVGAVFESGKPTVTDEPGRTDTPIGNLEVIAELVGSLLIAPLPVGDQIEGVLVLARGKGKPGFTDDDLYPVSQFAADAATAIQLAGARETQAALEVIADRDRIGRELHNTVIGRLFATGLALQGAAARTDDAELAARLNEAVQGLDEVIREIRTTIFTGESPSG